MCNMDWACCLLVPNSGVLDTTDPKHVFNESIVATLSKFHICITCFNTLIVYVAT